MIHVKDNFLFRDDFNALSQLMMGNEIDWHFNDRITDHHDNDFQFVHPFWRNDTPNLQGVVSRHFEHIVPIIKKINPTSLIRIKANLTTLRPPHDNPEYHLHIDFDKPCTTGIFYLNTTNGKTVFENGESIDCVENRFIHFPSHMRHMGTNHTDQKRRVVINFNFL
tara:strand:+ start:113 stop:610 length:498 start_codon:yes stop_codon:yes gene_type:complete